MRRSYRSTSWKRASPSARRRASARANRVRELKKTIDLVVTRAMREARQGRGRSVNGVTVIDLAIPKHIAETASKDVLLRQNNIVVKQRILNRRSPFA